MSKKAKTTSSSKSASSSTPDLSTALGDAFVFRINNMEVKISAAKKVHVKKGIIDIKY